MQDCQQNLVENQGYPVNMSNLSQCVLQHLVYAQYTFAQPRSALLIANAYGLRAPDGILLVGAQSYQMSTMLANDQQRLGPLVLMVVLPPAIG